MEAAFIADTMRRAHLLDGVPWSRMAVVPRSATASLGPVRRALTQAGVPVAVSSDDIALAAQPAVQPLLAAVGALLPPRRTTAEHEAIASGSEVADPAAADTEAGLDEAGAEALLASP